MVDTTLLRVAKGYDNLEPLLGVTAADHSDHDE